MDRCYENNMPKDTGCPECDKLSECNLCLKHELEQAEQRKYSAMNEVERIKQKQAEEKNITDIKTMTEMYETHEPLCPECGRRAFPTNFLPEHVGGEKYDKRTVWFCSDMGHCTFSVDKNTKWQQKLKKEKQDEFSTRKS